MTCSDSFCVKDIVNIILTDLSTIEHSGQSSVSVSSYRCVVDDAVASSVSDVFKVFSFRKLDLSPIEHSGSQNCSFDQITVATPMVLDEFSGNPVDNI